MKQAASTRNLITNALSRNAGGYCYRGMRGELGAQRGLCSACASHGLLGVLAEQRETLWLWGTMWRYCYIKVLKVKPVYQQMTLSPKLGVVGISTLWHFRLPLPIQMFIKVASSPRLSGIGMPSPILWSHPLKMQRIVLLSSLLWWELGTNSLITGPGEWLSFRRFTSNYPDPDPDPEDFDQTARSTKNMFCCFCDFSSLMMVTKWGLLSRTRSHIAKIASLTLHR